MADRPMRADARRNREAILAAARAAFAAGDFGLRFDDFAGLAGVGTGTLYRHFPTREALAAAVYRDEVGVLEKRADELGDVLPPVEALETYLHEFVTYLDLHRGLAYTLAAISELEAVVESSRAIEAAISRLVARAVAAQAIRTDVGAGAVLVALHGITTSLGRPEWRTESHGVVALLVHGLQTMR